MKLRHCLIATAALVLSACAQNREATYTPPPGLTPETAATITGSKATYDNTGALSRIVVVRIDGVATEAMNALLQEWDAKVRVSPGPHQVSVRVNLVKFPSQHTGIATIPLDAQAGESYAIRGMTPSPGANGKQMVDLWAETASGERRSPVISVPAYEPCEDTLFVPATSSSPAMFIPHHCPQR
jgi:hypothetical protein